jgi:hypothetical protein
MRNLAEVRIALDLRSTKVAHVDTTTASHFVASIALDERLVALGAAPNLYCANGFFDSNSTLHFRLFLYFIAPVSIIKGEVSETSFRAFSPLHD